MPHYGAAYFHLQLLGLTRGQTIIKIDPRMTAHYFVYKEILFDFLWVKLLYTNDSLAVSAAALGWGG
jgi:hypothetical protein